MLEGSAPREGRNTAEGVPGGTSRTALTVTLVLLAIMTVALAVDASSAPALVALVIVLMGGLIAALATWG